jgi:hypothetical protein
MKPVKPSVALARVRHQAVVAVVVELVTWPVWVRALALVSVWRLL